MTLPTDSPELTTDFPEENGRANVPGDSDPDPSLSDSSSKKYTLSNDTNSSKSNRNKCNKKKKRQKDKKDDLSEPSSSDSDSSYNSDYRRK